MRLQSAIFDMDGTLLDSMPTWRELGPTFLREADIEATPEQLHALRTMTDHEVIPYLREVCGLQKSPEEIMNEIIRRMEDFYSGASKARSGKISLHSENGGCLDVCCHCYPPAADGESSENCGHRSVVPGNHYLRRRGESQAGQRRHL